MKTNPNTKTVAKAKNKRFMQIFVCIFLAIVLVFGGVMLTVTLIRQSSYAVKYDGDGMDEKTAAYFISYYKYRYVRELRDNGVHAYDNPIFWNSKGVGNDKTYGEYLKEGAVQYLKEILVANALYSRYASLSDSDEIKISAAINDKLEYATGMDGSISTFNSLTAEYGFDYSSFRTAAEMMYKASHARSAIFGENGESLKSNTADCEDYLSLYSHVKIIFIDSERKKVTVDGVEQMVDMTEQEKLAMQEDIELLRAAIADGSVSPVTFELYYDRYNCVTGINADGEYYLEKNSHFTNYVFGTQFPEAVEAALELELDGADAYVESTYSDGICFIYKSAPEAGAYADSGLSAYFDDFYYNASLYFYNLTLRLYTQAATVTDKLGAVDIIALPYHYDYFITNF